jgi:hypothetical protein
MPSIIKDSSEFEIALDWFYLITVTLSFAARAKQLVLVERLLLLCYPS